MEHMLRVGERSFSFSDSILLMDTLRALKIPFPMPCGGHGHCGKCVVWVRGCCSEKSEVEETYLKSSDRLPHEGFVPRLACLCRLLGDGEVVIPKSNASIVMNTVGMLPAYDGCGTKTYGFAVDIGTTTIAMRLYALDEGKLLTTAAEINDQSIFGADVLSRIEYANVYGVQTLQKVMLSQIERMFNGMIREAACDIKLVERVVFVGNTTMLHFLTGLDPKEIGVSPFQPKSLFGNTFRANDLFPMFLENTEAYIPRCVGAYIGADVSAGMLAMAFDQKKRQLLVDIGTNGEIVLQNEERIICCATAAGPAFEGAQITMGVPAMDGAIVRVWMSDRIEYETIGNAKPRGICGTGLISLLALLKREGVLDETGMLQETNSQLNPNIQEVNGQKAFCIGDSGILLTMQDIRQIQLAKAAIAAGIDTLLAEEKIDAKDVDAFLLAGGFGSQMLTCDAVDIGLIPKDCAEQTIAVGNAALQGASSMLFSKGDRSLNQIIQRAVALPLSNHPVFIERYIENMMFPE